MSYYKDLNYIDISSDDDFDYLISRIKEGPTFAWAFKFGLNNLKDQFFSALGISLDEFNQKNFYYDDKDNLHISESENGYVWISTMGLVAQKNPIDNQYVNACEYQYIVLSLLLDKAINLCEDETIYDVESFNNEYLSAFTPTLFHNTLFYFETFGKAYLSLNNIPNLKTHKLSELLQIVKKTMFDLNHNDTLFHAHIIAAFELIVKYISTIRSNFREEYVKYADNPDDFTVIRFRKTEMVNMKHTIDLSYDFILNYYYDKAFDQSEVSCLKQGLLKRLLKKAHTDEERQNVINAYGYLIDKSSGIV
jgi:hypothetical protein